MSAQAGIFDGTELWLWDLDSASSAPLLSEATELSGLSVIAGTSAPARNLPCTALPDALPSPDIPPLSQDHPRTVTQGEEVTLAGFIAQNPKFDGILCLPSATSTLWAHVSAEEIVSMRRFLTGTMVSAAFDGLTLGDPDAFTEALSDTMSRPEHAPLRLAALKAEVDLDEIAPPEAASRATAALIGTELAATRSYWLGQPVAIIAPAPLRAPYRTALESQFVPVSQADGHAITLAGLRLARERLTR